MSYPLDYSIIVPVYNRPDEMSELLASLEGATTKQGWELIIIEDGSTLSSRAVVESYQGRLPIRYRETPNGGPARARNVGSAMAQGEWIIFFDSDVVVPPTYFEELQRSLLSTPCDAYGGPDAALPSFSYIQKAINYSMTSPLTTGGIRGGKRRATARYYPRTFNLGVKYSALQDLGGFSEEMRFGEDIDFGMRLYEKGYKVQLLNSLYVYHKRRVNFKKFFHQVFCFGKARVHLTARHPGSMKAVYLLPSLFVLVALAVLCLSPLLFLSLATVFALLLFIDACFRTRDIRVAAVAVLASIVQLVGYGSGYLVEAFRYYILKKRPAGFCRS